MSGLSPKDRRGNRRYVPPQASSVTQHILTGTLDSEVKCPPVYAGRVDINTRLGTVFIILKDKEAALSARDFAAQLIEVVDRIYPDLDAELERQRHERASQLRIADRGDRDYLNGGASRSLGREVG